MLAETERLYSTVTTGLINVRKTEDGVVGKEKRERVDQTERGRQRREEDV